VSAGTKPKGQPAKNTRKKASASVSVKKGKSSDYMIEGMLKKEGRNFLKPKQDRYFVLSKDGETLSCFYSKDEVRKKSDIDLTKATFDFVHSQRRFFINTAERQWTIICNEKVEFDDGEVLTVEEQEMFVEIDFTYNSIEGNDTTETNTSKS